MRTLLLASAAFIVGTGLAGGGLVNKASAYPVQFYTGITNGNQFNADASVLTSNPFSSYVGASFDYNGPLNLRVGPPQNSNSDGDKNGAFFAGGSISNYALITGNSTIGSPANANFSNVTNFLNSSASAAGYTYGSLVLFNLGTLVSGTVLTIAHDDGISLYQGSSINTATRIGTTTSGPTQEITESVRISNTGQTFLVYGRENGAPSVLNVAVPEPMSLALLGTGLVGLGLVRRKKRTS